MSKIVSKATGLLLCVCMLMIGGGVALAETDTMFQVSTLNALMLGLYDGAITVRDFLLHGDTGLGTMNHLDGEMVVLDGVVYQVKMDGSVVSAPADQTIPFGVITTFETDATETLTEPVADMDALVAYLNGLELVAENPNRIYAIKLTGHFDGIHVRTVPAQEKPYPPLSEVTANQAEFEYTDLEGTLIGVYFPDYLADLNMDAWHLHFLSGDLSKGGHVLDVQGVSGEVSVDAIDGFTLMMPDTVDFASASLAEDLSDSISSVENK